MTSFRAGPHVEWIPTQDGNRYVLHLEQHELDIITDALWEYQQAHRGARARTAELAGAIRRILNRAVVAVYWDATRIEAVAALPPEST